MVILLSHISPYYEINYFTHSIIFDKSWSKKKKEIQKI